MDDWYHSVVVKWLSPWVEHLAELSQHSSDTEDPLGEDCCWQGIKREWEGRSSADFPGKSCTAADFPQRSFSCPWRSSGLCLSLGRHLLALGTDSSACSTGLSACQRRLSSLQHRPLGFPAQTLQSSIDYSSAPDTDSDGTLPWAPCLWLDSSDL